MTYLEIIEWIEMYVTEIRLQMNELYLVTYLSEENGVEFELGGKDLISIVLGINNKELIK